HVYIEVHVGDAGGSAYEKHRRTFNESAHQVFRPGKILCQFRGMTENIEKKYAPFRGAATHHINILTKSDIVVCFIYGGIGITFDVIVNANLFVANYLLEIVPGPFIIGSPV